MIRFNSLLSTGLLLAVALPLASANAQPINLVLKLKERVSMQTLADNAVKYGVTYTPEQIRKITGPSKSDYADLISQLKQQGFEIISESRTHLFITVRAEKESIENSFQTKLLEENGVRRALTSKLIPQSLTLIDSVVGLSNERKLKPRFRALQEDADSKSKGLTQGGILPAAIKTQYGFDAIYSQGFTGKGQHISIATFDGFKEADVNAYYKKIKLSPAPTLDTVSFNGTAAYNIDSAMETELDAEFSGMIAPGANIHVFASAENSDAGELAMFTAILNDNRAKVVNYSWGSCEPEVSPDHKTAMDTVFAQAVAQGVNVMVASGDSGSAGCQDQPSTVAPDAPANNPNVVAVGGTTLGGANFETGWADSGGGISAVYALPSFQQNLAAPYTMRSIPDVSFNADPATGEAAWECVDGATGPGKTPTWITLGGTSIAAPQWSGFLTLVAEARASKGLPTLGALNPIIYGFNATDYAATFHDVTSGNNTQSGAAGYAAGPGWDAVTGLGSMKADALFAKLTQ